MILEPASYKAPRKTPNHPDWAPLDESDGRPNSTRITDFLVFFCLVVGINVPGLNQPLNQLAPLFGVIVAYTRRPLPGPKVPNWFWGWLVAWIGWLAMSTYVRQAVATELYAGNTYKRLLHLVLDCFVMMAIATGRFDLRSATRGLSVSLMIGVGYALATINSSGYDGRLTGWVGDPNTAGFVIGTLGLASLPRLTNRWRPAFAILMLVGLIATFSRTSLIALGVAVLWILVARKIPVNVSYLLLALVFWGISSIPMDWKGVGPFVDRSGSDLLRGRIDEAGKAMADQYPWTGNGVGNYLIPLQNDHWFFHNTYDLMRSEGGWIALILFMTLVFMTFWKLTRVPTIQRNPWIEGAIVMAIICGINLGEVLANTVFAVLMGLAMRYWLNCQVSKPNRGEQAVPVEFR